MTHTRWRGGQDWKDMGLGMTTGSDHVCKLYDAALTQIITYTDDASMGGLEGTMKEMLTTDPKFLMGHALANSLQLLRNNGDYKDNPQLVQGMDTMVKLLDSGASYSNRERKHVEAAQKLYKGEMFQAASIWEDILVDHPHDLTALKLASYMYFFTGSSYQLRDSVARVLPEWRPHMPLYGALHSMHAFGLHESWNLREAEVAARKALSFNSHDPWARHSLSHVMEMSGRQREGVDSLENTVDDWKVGNMIACHNYWHWAVFFVDLREYESALSVFDQELLRRARKSESVHDFADMGSLLFRLQMEGVNVGDRWDDVYNMCKSHIHDHKIAFYDLHLLLSCLRANKPQAVKKMMASLHDFVRKGKGVTREVHAEVGESLLGSFVAYNEGDFGKAVDLLNPVRYSVYKIGGSIAQKDLVNLFLIQAAMKSPRKEHNRLAKSLLNERKVLKPNSPMTDRLMAKVLETHGE